jgi:predicted RNase H-like HicB family nuclease
MTKHSFVILIEKDEDGVFIGSVPLLKGCYSYGDTFDELMANLKEAIRHISRLLQKKRRRCLLLDSRVFKR